LIIVDPDNLEVVDNKKLAVFTDVIAKVISNIIGDRIYTFVNTGWAGQTRAAVLYIGSFNHDLTQDFYKQFTYKDSSFQLADSELSFVRIQEFGTKIAFYSNNPTFDLGLLIIHDTQTETFVLKTIAFTNFRFSGQSDSPLLLNVGSDLYSILKYNNLPIPGFNFR